MGWKRSNRPFRQVRSLALGFMVFFERFDVVPRGRDARRWADRQEGLV